MLEYFWYIFPSKFILGKSINNKIVLKNVASERKNPCKCCMKWLFPLLRGLLLAARKTESCLFVISSLFSKTLTHHSDHNMYLVRLKGSLKEENYIISSRKKLDMKRAEVLQWSLQKRYLYS